MAISGREADPPDPAGLSAYGGSAGISARQAFWDSTETRGSLDYSGTAHTARPEPRVYGDLPVGRARGVSPVSQATKDRVGTADRVDTAGNAAL